MPGNSASLMIGITLLTPSSLVLSAVRVIILANFLMLYIAFFNLGPFIPD